MTSITPRIQSKIFLAKLLVALSILGLGLYLVSIDSMVAICLGTILIGSMFAHAVELQHQCLHNTGFKSRAANRIVGILLGLPTLSSFHRYRRAHMEHHRSLGTPNDVTFFTYQFLENPSVGSFLYDFFGISHLKSALSSVFLQGKSGLITDGSSTDEDYTAERIDYALMAFMLACFYLYSITTGSDLLLKAWLLPMLLVAQPVHFLVELPEHIGCASSSTDPFRNTRTIRGSWFSYWFTNGNNFHVEHHLAPALSMDQLKELFLESKGQHHFYHDTYFNFFTSIFRLARAHRAELEVDQTARRPA